MHMADLQQLKEVKEPKNRLPLLKFSAAMILTINQTIPLYMKHPEEDDSYVMPVPRVGELLFPAFNILVP
jgi:hypothetical protein